MELSWKMRYAADADSNDDILAGREVRTSYVFPQYEVTEFEADFAHGQSKGWETRKVRSLFGEALGGALRGAFGSEDIEDLDANVYADSYTNVDSSDAGIALTQRLVAQRQGELDTLRSLAIETHSEG